MMALLLVTESLVEGSEFPQLKKRNIKSIVDNKENNFFILNFFVKIDINR